MSAEYAYAPCPPPPASVLSGVRRQYDHQPAVTVSTSLGAAHRQPAHLGSNHTPSTASSTRSSPFVGYGSPALAASPDGPSSHTSPVGSNGSSFAYDPSQWAPNVSHQPLAAAPAARNTILNGYSATAPGLSPPPPYSPQHQGRRQERTSPIEQTRAPASALPSRQHGPQLPVSRVVSREQQSPDGTGVDSERALTFPPPPSASAAGRRSRSSSRTRNERAQPLFSLSALSSRLRSSSQVSHIQRAETLPANGSPSLDRPPPTPRRALTATHSFVEGGHNSVSPLPGPSGIPPSSRRSASAGAIGLANGEIRVRPEGRSPSGRAWEPGMPLPPPPPGPPPAVRSQSLTRSSERGAAEDGASARPAGVVQRRALAVRTSLPPVPPTPAGWTDSVGVPSAVPHGASIMAPPASNRNSRVAAEVAGRNSLFSESGRVDSANAALPDSGPKGIRERRSESRNRRSLLGPEGSAGSEGSNNPWAEDLSRVDTVVPANLTLPANESSLARRSADPRPSPQTRPQLSLEGRARSGLPMQSSAGNSPANAVFENSRPVPVSASSSAWRVGSPSHDTADSARPVSHILHTANPDIPLAPPLTPARSPGVGASADSANPHDFTRAAIERHRLFAEKEAAATDDRERVRLFAEFIVAESRLRRIRYAHAIDSMGSQILDLTRDLFRPYPETPTLNAPPARISRQPSQASLNSVVHEAFNSTTTPPPSARPESAWWSGYMPSLSPIPSMSTSVVPDEMSSRGRAPSRWWEASQAGSAAGDGARGLERSKRESKYMGLPLRDWEDAPSTGNSTTVPSTQTLEFPPEKAGWHDQVTPRSSDPRKLDVSRLVTLPPPYPRHYPAVNNHHPDLASLRTVLRTLSDLTEVTEAKQTYASRRGDREAEAERQCKQRLDDVRRMVEHGRMSYAEAAEAEKAEKRKASEAPKAELNTYQTEVVKPMQALLSQRIVTATASYNQLKAQLADHNPVEEGDEKPELLEKLTLLKWLFEAREQLHREMFDLSTSANEQYRQVVVAPYTDERRIREVCAFFEKDEAERRARYEKEALARVEQFMGTVEATVQKGVEVQLSTFWDIAPPLVDVIQRVNVEQGVQADESEYAFSQQYLWEVLTHAEKSAYQFIEAQVNLLCLLHEVKGVVTKQSCKVMAAERRVVAVAGEASSSAGVCEDDDMADVLKAEEERLTADLQEKVATVEKQWQEAMGQVVEPLKGRVREWLQQHGGWEVCEEDA